VTSPSSCRIPWCRLDHDDRPVRGHIAVADTDGYGFRMLLMQPETDGQLDEPYVSLIYPSEQAGRRVAVDLNPQRVADLADFVLALEPAALPWIAAALLDAAETLGGAA
jgi:hypothetical protein